MLLELNYIILENRRQIHELKYVSNVVTEELSGRVLDMASDRVTISQGTSALLLDLDISALDSSAAKPDNAVALQYLTDSRYWRYFFSSIMSNPNQVNGLRRNRTNPKLSLA